MGEPRYGDNIFELGGAVLRCLRQAGWSPLARDAVAERLNEAKTYDEAIAICRQYITIRNES